MTSWHIARFTFYIMQERELWANKLLSGRRKSSHTTTGLPTLSTIATFDHLPRTIRRCQVQPLQLLKATSVYKENFRLHSENIQIWRTAWISSFICHMPPMDFTEVVQSCILPLPFQAGCVHLNHGPTPRTGKQSMAWTGLGHMSHATSVILNFFWARCRQSEKWRAFRWVMRCDHSRTKPLATCVCCKTWHPDTSKPISSRHCWTT